MNQTNRRRFLKRSAGTALTLGLAGRPETWAAANDAVRLAVIGVRGRGTEHIKGFGSLKGVEIAAICDVDENIIKERLESHKEYLKPSVKTYTDVRELLQDKSIDAVTIATPNHWHSLIAIWACQAGKDVYVEKPCSHNIYEGRKLVEASRKYNRIVQHGTQGRSVGAFREAIQHLRDGLIGEVYYAKGTCYKWRDTIGHKPDGTAPAGVDYNLWLGPAEKKPFNPNRFHYNWHWNWDYGNGDIGNQGVHEMDIARWGLGVGLPKVVSALGGHFMFDDDQLTPNTLVAAFKYPDENKMLVFEVRHWITNSELGAVDDGNVIGDIFLGSKGVMITHSYGEYKTFFGRERKPGPSKTTGETHFQNFIDAVRSRKREDQNAEILEGHLSASLCHLANASYRVGRTLQFDPKTERCVNDEEADAILRGTYREPFIVPDTI